MAGKNNPVNSYQEATNQLLAINAQRKNNVSQAKMEEMVAAAQNNTLAQASDFVASNPTTTTMNADLNPATQNILRQYGLGQPKIQKTSSSSREVNKQNIVINNKNTTVTNNNVQVSPQTGPTQGRPLQLQDQGQIRFKTWLSNSFAQQNEISAKRQREYAKRDSALERSSNKLMKKLEDMGTKVATNLNPKNMASSMGKQLKTLLLVFGFGYMAKNWPRLINTVDRIGKFFKPGEGLVKMLGGKENETFFQAFKKLFTDPDEGIFPYIGQWLKSRFKERGEAVKSLTKPDVSWVGGEGLEKNITRILGNVVGYLGDILKAIMDPTSAASNAVKSTATNTETKYQRDNHDILREKSGRIETWNYKTQKKETVVASEGDRAIVEGKYRAVKPGSVDSDGNLVNTPIASVSQGNEIVGAIENSKTGKIQTASVATGLSRLYNAAKKNEHGVVLSEEFLTQYLTEEELKKLGLERSKKFIYVIRPKTDEERALDNLDINRDTHEANKFGTYLESTGFGFGIGSAIRKIDDILKDENPDTTIELRDASQGVNFEAGERVFENGGVPKNLYEVPPEAIQMIADKLTGKQNINIDLGNEEFVKAIENSLLKNVPEGTNLRDINRDIDVDRTYSVNRMIESNNAELQERRDNLRLKAGIENTKDMAGEAKNNIHNRIFGDYSSNYNTYENYGWASSAANFSSGDLSGVIEASKRGVFYSDESNGKGQGSHGPSSPGENGRGYIEIKKNVYQHKCTSGPETFYYDGTNGKVDIRHPKDGSNKYQVWWDTGHPYNATDSRLDKVGFKKIFTGPLLKRTKDVQEAMKKKGLELKPGDIMTMFGIKKSGKYSSHAQMWNGEQWVSDTYQGDLAFVYPNSRPGKNGEAIQIWRYDNSSGESLASNVDINKQSSENPDVDNGIDEGGNNTLASVSNISTGINGTGVSGLAVQPTLITANSNMTNQYPSAFSSGGDNTTAFSSTNDIIKPIDYSKKLNDVNLNLVALQQVLKEEVGVTGQGVDATHDLASAISGALRTSQKQPESRSYTDRYNDKLSKRS